MTFCRIYTEFTLKTFRTLARMGHIVDQALGQTLRKLRTERGWSQADLAARADMDRNYLSLIELGRNSPSVRMLWRLCYALDVRVTVVLADTEQRVTVLERAAWQSPPATQPPV